MVYIGLEHCRHSVADYRVLLGCRVFSLSFFMYSAREMAETGQTTERVAKPGKPGWSSENFVFSFVTFRWICLFILLLFKF